MIVDALGSWGVLPFRLPLLLWIPMGYGPALAALIVTAATEGNAGVRALLGRLLIRRVGWRWYALVLVGSALPPAITLGLYAFLGGQVEGPPLGWSLLLQVPIVFLVRLLLNGEELGWRGYALPRLQDNHSALVASLILGLPWALFHLPLFFTQGNAVRSMPPLSYLLSILALSILFTWVFNHTRGSVLLATLLHQAWNVWTDLYHPDSVGITLHAWLSTGVLWLAALLVVAAYGAGHLSRTARVAAPTAAQPR